RRQDLQRHLMARIHVNGPIDRAHASRPKGAQDTITPVLEFAELGTDRLGLLHAIVHLGFRPSSGMAGRRVKSPGIGGSLPYEVECRIDLQAAKDPSGSCSGDW